uniref:Uncharacterized protein n=1 Tax=Steinernema glaseri TaxID=37863 RepID=A0A1I7Y635_9BILA
MTAALTINESENKEVPTDDVVGVHQGSAAAVDASSHGAESVGIRRRDVDQRHVELDGAATEETRDLGQEDRVEVRATLVDSSPGTLAGEEAVGSYGS